LVLLVVWKDISNRVNNFLTTPPLGVAPESIRGRMSNTEEKDASSESKAVSDNGSCRPPLRERMETGGYFTTDLFVRLWVAIKGGLSDARSVPSGGCNEP
jgi:hypothetical protein